MFDKNLVFFKYGMEHKKENITINDIQKFEKKYLISLPIDYKEFLLNYRNFGFDFYYEIEDKIYNIFNRQLDLSEINCSKILGFSSLSEIKEEIKINILCNYKDYIYRKKLLPITTDIDSFYSIFIGVGENNNGKIYALRLGAIELSYLPNPLKLICNSFTEFLEGFYLKEDNNNED
jgi:hypothetical protein